MALLVSTVVVVCSWYGPGFDGNIAASGEVFDQNAMTAAHYDLPFGTIVELEHNGNRVIVEINDRGPYCFNALRSGYLKRHPTRDIDLSQAAFEKLAPLGAGIIDAKVVRMIRPGVAPPVFIPPPPIDGASWAASDATIYSVMSDLSWERVYGR